MSIPHYMKKQKSNRKKCLLERPGLIIMIITIKKTMVFLMIFLTMISVFSCVVWAEEITNQADKIEVLFDGELSDVIPLGASVKDGTLVMDTNGRLTTVKQMQNFMMLLDLKEVKNGNLEIAFGASQSITFKKDSCNIESSGMKTADGKTNLQLRSENIAGDVREVDIFKANTTLRLTVMGKNVTLGLMQNGEAVELLSDSLASFILESDVQPGVVSVLAKDGAQAVLDNLKIYSLMPSIAIEKEDYVVPPEAPQEEAIKEVTLILGLPIWLFSVIAGGAAIVLAGIITALILILKKKKGTVKHEKIS